MSGPQFCRWLWHAVTVLCDGTVTCGLDDPFKLRNYGNVLNAPLREIMASAQVAERRLSLLNGLHCDGCQLQTEINSEHLHELAPSLPLPRKLVIEPSIRCNIRCNNSVCNIANDASIKLRTTSLMQWEVFTKTLDEIGPGLSDLYFYNYGESFVHPKAPDMLAYARRVNPLMKITSSTNGIPLARKPLAERLVDEQLVDWLCFTIGGSDEESYLGYHKAGSFAKAIEGMRNVAEAKRRLGLTRPIIHWRYLLFRWNDSDRHIREALRLAHEIGVDEFRFFVTSTPLEGRSLRRAPGTSGFQEIAEWVDYEFHYHVDGFLEAGMWHPESSPRLGKLTWTGRSARVLALPAEDRINIRLARPGMPSVPRVTAEVTLPWGTFPADIGDDAWADNFFAVPPAHAEFGEPVRVGIDVSDVFNPRRYGIGNDQRDLGVMVSLDGIAPFPNPFRTQVLPDWGPWLGERGGANASPDLRRARPSAGQAA